VLLDQQQCAFQVRQVFWRTAPASNPDSIKVPANGHRQFYSVRDARTKRPVVFLAHDE
jgi:hypothetical protein